MISANSYMARNVAAVLVIVAVTTISIPLSQATIVVISKTTNETVFSAEETGIDAASAYNLKGGLIIADPIDACSEVKPPPPSNHTIIIPSLTGQGEQVRRKDSWILWAVYNYTDDACSLSRKAKEAEYAGYSAIVVTVFGTNDTQGVLPSFMGFDWMGIGVYTSILGENMGNALKKFAYPKKYYVEFQNEPYFQLGLLANFVFLGCLGIILVVILLRLSHCLYMRVSSSVQERRRKRKAYLTESQLKKLPVLHWRTSIPQDTCSICIENFEVGEEIRVLPCSHVFHKPCIDPWLIHSSRRCPNCKGKVIFPNEHFSDSSNSDSDSHMDDSDDDFGVGNERTPLLRAHSDDSDDQIADTRFVESQTHAHQIEGPSSSSSNALRNSAPEQGHIAVTTDLIDISSGSEHTTVDDSFGSFQSAHSPSGKNEAVLVDVECNQSLASAKSFDSDRTYVGESNLTSKDENSSSSSSSNISSKTDELTSSMGSNASFFSCLESELEKSTAINSNHELFQSFAS